SEMSPALNRLLESGAASEAVLLSTCNRTELYLSVTDLQRGEAAARALLAERGEGPPEANARYLYARRDRLAADHLFRVTSGLDSMIVGEPQIQGQVKEAYLTAREVTGRTGPVVGPTLNR